MPPCIARRSVEASCEPPVPGQVEGVVSAAAAARFDIHLGVPVAELSLDDRVAEAVGGVLAELDAEERFLLAAYYLDRQTLAAIGRQLGIAESTISRRMKKLTSLVRERIQKRLVLGGMETGRCDEVLEELDVRDLNVDVARNLRQEK